MLLHPKRSFLLAFSAAALCAAPAFAQTDTPPVPPASQSDAPPPPPPDGGPGHGGPRRGGPEHRVEMMQHMLNLSPDQTAQVKTVFAAERTRMEALHANNAAAGTDRRSEMMAIHQDTQAKIRALLTPDQVTKYDAMEARMREHRPGPGGPDGPAGPPPPPPSSSNNPGER